MKRKTMMGKTPDEIDKLCNDFELTHDVKFTQPSFFIFDRVTYFVVALLYQEKQQKEYTDIKLTNHIQGDI